MITKKSQPMNMVDFIIQSNDKTVKQTISINRQNLREIGLAFLEAAYDEKIKNITIIAQGEVE